jgi:hypothetical protein
MTTRRPLMTIVTSVQAQYKAVDGWHIFTSRDVPGLYVASKDAKIAYDDVALSIQMLLRLNEGIECEVRAEQTFQEFLRTARGDEEDEEFAIPVMSSRRFALLGCAA